MPTNEYDQLLVDASGGNEYSDLLQDQNKSNAQEVQASMYATRFQDPDRAARIQRLAKEVGLGEDQVERNFDDINAEHAVAKNDYDKLVDETPRLAGFLKNPGYAAVAKDDLKAMGSLESSVKEHGMMNDLINTLASGAANFNNQLLNLPGLAYDVAAYPVNLAAKALGSDQRVSSKQLGLNFENTSSQYYASKVEGLSDSTIDAIGKGEYAKAGRTLALQLVQSAPALTAAMFTGGVSAAGPALTFAATTAAESNAQANETGQDPLVSVPSSLAKGAVQGAVQNAFGMSKILTSWEGAMTRQYGKKISGEVMREFSKTVAYSVGGEGIAQGAQAGATDVLDYISGLRPDSIEGIGARMVDSAIMGGAMGGLMLSPQAAGLGFARAHEVRRAQQTKDFYLSFGKSAEALKMRERLPEGQRDFINQVTEGSGTENVYLPVEAMQGYFQSKKVLPEVAAQELGILKEYNAAVETGEDLQIPLSTWAEKAAGTDAWAALADDVKFDPGKPSVKEARELHAETARSVIEEARRAREEQDAFESSVKFVSDDVSMQLRDAGYSQKDANTNAQLYGAFFRSLSERTGLKPSELYQEYGLSIKSQPEFQMTAEQMAVAQAAGTTFNQDSSLRPSELVTESGDLGSGEVTPTGVSIGREVSITEAMSNSGKADAKQLANLLELNSFKPEKERLLDTPSRVTMMEKMRSLIRKDLKVIDTIVGTVPVDMVNNLFGSELAAKEALHNEAMLENVTSFGIDDPVSTSIDISSPLDTLLSEAALRAAEVSPTLDVTRGSEDLSVAPKADQTNLSQTSSDGPRAQIRFGKDRQFNIDLFKNRDASSLIHESGHFFLEVMGDLALRENVAQSLKDDYKTVLDYLKVESREDIKVEQHEIFARSFENFLMEGKAPSTALRKAFNTFKTWLTSVYRSAKSLNVELSDEIRGVMDRLLVSDEQVTRAEETMNYDAFVADPVAMMGEKRGQEYIEAKAKARESADDVIRTKLMEDVQKKQRAEYKASEKTERETIRTELADTRDYKALDVLQGRVEGEALKLSKESIREAYGDDVLKSIPRGTTASDGVHVEVAAQMLGYANGKELVESLANKPRLKDAVEERLASRMQELFPDYLLNPNISDDAIKAVHNNNRQKVLRLEMEYLLENNPGLAKDVAKKVIGRMPREEAVKEQARIQVGDRTIKDIRPVIYQRAEVKASREAAKAYAAGDWQGAFEAKRKELLNNELYRSAIEAQDEVAKQVQNFKRLFKANEDIAKTRDMDYVDAARAVLAAHGLARADKTPAQYLEKMKAYNPSGYEAAVAIVNSALENQTGTARDSYESMRLQDFTAMSDAVNAMWDLAKTSREQTVDGRKVQTGKVLEDLVARAISLTDPNSQRGIGKAVSDSDKRAIALMGVKSRFRRMEHWAYTFDGGDINGPATQYIYRPVRDAETRLQLDQVETAKVIREAVKKLPKDDGQPIAAPEIGHTFKDKNELRAALLHTGNNSNLYKLLIGGRGPKNEAWGFRNEDGSLDRSKWDAMINRMHREGIIVKEDWDFVQSLWDESERLKPAAQKAHKQVTGFYFDEVTRNGFTTPFGDYAGGYAPAKVDSYLNADAQTRLDKATLDGFNSTFAFPTAGRGFTKSRVEAYAAPLDLDLKNLMGTYNSVLKFTHMEPVVVEIGRLLRDESFKSAMFDKDPTAISEMIVPWLQRSASQKVSTPSDGRGGQFLDKGASLLRRNVSLSVMAMNVPNMVENLFGVLPASTRIAPTHLAATYAEALRSPTKMHDLILEKSDFMKTKMGENAREINRDFDQLILKPTKFDTVGEAATKFAMLGEKASNHLTEMVVWSSSYRQALEKGLSEADAVKTADATTRQVLTDSSPSSISRNETGTAFSRLFTMFSTWFNNQANLLGSEVAVARQMGIKTKEGAKRAALAYMMVVAAPAILGNAIKRSFKGQNMLDADEDGNYADDAIDLLLYSQFGYVSAMTGPAGNFLNAVINKTNDNPFDDRVNLSPVVSSIETAIKAPQTIGEAMRTGRGSGAAVRNGAMAIGLVSGLPVSLVGKPLGYLADVDERKAQPTGPIDFTRGLVTGKPGGKAKF